jgi:Ni/Co efflux regulator RcnB
MVKMKKILGILLALCFVLSVTAGAASANGNDRSKFGDHKQKFDDHKQKFDGHKQKFGDYKQKFDRYNKGKWVPGHYEVKIVKKVVYKHHKKFVIVEKIKVWIPGHWVKFHYK